MRGPCCFTRFQFQQGKGCVQTIQSEHEKCGVGHEDLYSSMEPVGVTRIMLHMVTAAGRHRTSSRSVNIRNSLYVPVSLSLSPTGTRPRVEHSCSIGNRLGSTSGNGRSSPHVPLGASRAEVRNGAVCGKISSVNKSSSPPSEERGG
jgi:hypothetical protein